MPEQERAQAAAEGQTPDVRWHQSQGRDALLGAGRPDCPARLQGALRGYGKILRDSTARRQIEEALAVSEERQRMALEGADIGTWHWDLVADILLWSDRCKAIFGLTPDAAMSYEIFLDLLHPDDREATEQAVVRALSSRTDYDIEYRVVWPDAGIHWVNAKGRGYYDAQGTPQRFEGIVQDITERRRIAEELAERAERESLLNRIGAALRATLDPEIVQARAMTVLGRELGADRCYYGLFDESYDQIRIGRDWHRDDLPALAGEYPLSGTRPLPGRPLRRRKNAGRQRRAARRCRRAPFHERALISVPFYDGGRCVAALTVAMADRPRAWTPGEVSLVEIAATQVRAAIEAARTFQREQNIALSLQEALQPALPRHVEGMDLAFFYKSALKESNVGGDFADVFTLDGAARPWWSATCPARASPPPPRWRPCGTCCAP